MKRRLLLRELRRTCAEAGVSFEFLRHGAEHDQYLIGRQMIAVPRHREINEWTARGILRDVQRIVGREEGA